MKSTLFIYSLPEKGFSGQAKASELIVAGFKNKNIPVSLLHPPAIDRTSKHLGALNYFFFLFRLLLCWLRALVFRFNSLCSVHLTLGQTLFALLRDGVTLYFVTLFQGDSLRSVVALHGSVFLNWEKKSWEAMLFLWIVRKCSYVTCLGERHRKSLINLGVSKEKIHIVYNVCEYDVISEGDLLQKHTQTLNLNILFLSSLIDTKGFPEYLEALEVLSRNENYILKAVLCGPITITPYSERFKSKSEAQDWIESKVERINHSSNLKVEWIPGASGTAKAQLFKNAHVFILPSRYKVEAQPLAVIEAMAWGATVITSTVGELLSTVDHGCAIILDSTSAEAIADSLERLIVKPELRQDLALAARNRVLERFDRDSYIKNWCDLLRAHPRMPSDRS